MVDEKMSERRHRADMKGQGWVIEWFKVPVLKTGVLQKVPWVRIPLRPKDLKEGVSKSVEVKGGGDG